MKISVVLSGILFLIVTASTLYGQRQGIRGQVFWVSGNQMPGPGKSASPQLGIQREIYIHNVTTVEKENQVGPFFNEVKSEFVTKVLSKPDGSFKVKLPPGEYSVFVKEPNGLFANLVEGDGKINPVSIPLKRFVWMTITIDYEAVY
jgi:hypothetical protein